MTSNQKPDALPQISVIMGVYNGQAYLAEAIESILAQTCTDFEFIIIDDGSTDSTPEILAGYNDPRLRVVTQANVGLTRSLNRALKLAWGKYIARMDADDIAHPDRFAKQVAFLERNPEVGVLGTSIHIRDEIEAVEADRVMPEHDAVIRAGLIKGNPFIHASVMVRKRLLDQYGGYDPAFVVAQDYALWVKLAPHTRFANLPDVLLTHREHWQTVSMIRRKTWLMLCHSIWLRMRIRYRAFRNLAYPPHYLIYVLQPIPFTVIELRPNFQAHLQRLFSRSKGP